MELIRGDHVRLRDQIESHIFGDCTFRIVRFYPGVVHVNILGLSDSVDYEFRLNQVYRVCRNCGKPRSIHAVGGKCLFAPTRWS